MTAAGYLKKGVRRILKMPGKAFYKSLSKAAIDVLDDDLFSSDRSSLVYTSRTKRGDIKFVCPGEIPLRRAKRALEKEPDTIEWIDGFQPNEVLWDIGANVGVYSLYAGINRRVRVMAFEPLAENYYLLTKNIEINNLDEIITSLNLAFNDTTVIDRLNTLDTNFGAAQSYFGTLENYAGDTINPIFRQGVIGYSIDGFIQMFNPPFPNHIKIDVDGNEAKIISGARETLQDPRLRSLVMEWTDDRPETPAIKSLLAENGFKEISRSCVEVLPEKGLTFYNYLYRRDRKTAH